MLLEEDFDLSTTRRRKFGLCVLFKNEHLSLSLNVIHGKSKSSEWKIPRAYAQL